ncbi:MAG: hypothetical protein CMN85_10570 [Spongiibacteraceae bacterium]|nr:hypothetical protein [Spongiibacteraceae bacterium]|tara:strand:+ start:13357 stop:13599 length:243 start_codon:yes stop_codon:yes gene_type:complete
MQATALGKASAEMGVKVTKKSGEVYHLKGDAVAEYKPVYVLMECIEVEGKLHPQKKLVVRSEDAEKAFHPATIKQLRESE